MMAVNAAVTLERPLLIKANLGRARPCSQWKSPRHWTVHCCNGT